MLIAGLIGSLSNLIAMSDNTKASSIIYEIKKKSISNYI
jgi:hypothetical protein